jgi:hypothetical protein
MRVRLPAAHRSRSPRRARAIADLRRAIDCLPPRTREAMLAGVRDAAPERPIVAGAYTALGGICPMLAAHRAGGRTDLLAFAHAWDRFTGVGRAPRVVTPRELGVLVAHLEASLLGDATPELALAIESHRRAVALRLWRERVGALRVLDPPGDAIRVRRLRPARVRGRVLATARPPGA